MTAVAKLQRKVSANVGGMISASIGIFAMAFLIHIESDLDSAWLRDLSLILCVANVCMFGWFLHQAFAAVSKLAAQSPIIRPPTEDRLDELERLKRRDMVTPEEYAAKRQEILKDL